MNDDIKILRSKFDEIKKIGWIKSDTINSGIIGTTFENLIGLSENQFEIPDFGSIEIKTKSYSKYRYISLFNCVPTGPHYHEVERIKDSFGYPDSQLKQFKVFHGDVFGNRLEKIGNEFYFKLNIYRNKRKITLSVYDSKKKKVEEIVYWDFDILEEKLNRKLAYLALINTKKRKTNNLFYFKYDTISFYKLKNFNTFINLLENGFIKITFKLGVFRDNKRLGKIHDRGTAFSIEEQNINMLFERIE